MLLQNLRNVLQRNRLQSRRRSRAIAHGSASGIIESLETRLLLAADFGDAPLPYPVTSAEGGAEHEEGGPTLGATFDTEANGTHSAAADADGADDDGVTFGTVRVGQVDATVTVNVQNAPSGAKLDAWIDFNRDGHWGGAGEQIFDTVDVVNGDNVLTFDVPATALSGSTFARFRLSTAGDLGHGGMATDGEVEDLQVTIEAPVSTSGLFGGENVIGTDSTTGERFVVTDLDGDGDLDIVTGGERLTWRENTGDGTFGSPQELAPAASIQGPVSSIHADDFDGDGDMDLVVATGHSSLFDGGELGWYENDGTQNFTERALTSVSEGGFFSVVIGDADGNGQTDVFAGWTVKVAQDVTTDVIMILNGGAVQAIDQPAISLVLSEAADLDRDGDLDVLPIAFTNDNVRWLENDGNQTFSVQSDATRIDEPQARHTTDIDGDGDLDIVAIAGQDEDFVVWLENDGNQNYTFRQIATDSNEYRDVIPADLDGDGDVDVLSIVPGNGTLSWHRNSGSGSFSAGTISTSATAHSLLAADLDGDGDLDVVGLSSDGKLAWHENLTNVDMDFGDAPAPFPTTFAEDGAAHVATGPTLGSTRDSEADGTHSAAADADGADEDGVTFGGVQVGQLDATVTVNVQSAPSGAKLDAWIDFDGDGNWGGPGEQIFDSIDVVAGDNQLTFDVPANALSGDAVARFRLSTSGGLGTKFTAADGEVEDYVVAITPPGAASGLFNTQTVIGTDDNADFAVITVDLDGDGDLDIVSADDGVHWRANQGDGTFGSQQQIFPDFLAPDVRDLFAADMDADGDLDIVAAEYGADDISWYENDGTLTFNVEHEIGFLVDGVMSVSAADMDGDGDIDVLAAGGLDDSLLWFENLGAANFAQRIIRADSGTTAFHAQSVVAVDVDRDGDMDILNATSAGDTIRWYENDGSGTFTDRIVTTTAIDVYHAVAADVDGDGDIDFVSASEGDDTVAWYENDGSQNFTKRTITNSADGVVHVFAADVDGDGDTDVLSASRLDDTIALHKNDGSGNFSTFVITTAADAARKVTAGDIDGDGDLDVVSVSSADHKLAWYEQVVGNATPSINLPIETLTENALFPIDWTPAVDAVSYEVWYTNATTGQAPFINETVTGTTFTPSAALPIGRYFIWVRANLAGGGKSNWSSSVKLQVNTRATLHSLPFHGTDLTPTISWDALPGADHYDLWVNNVTTGQSQVLRDANIGGTSFTPTADLGFGQYRIWVRGMDAINRAAAWSTPVDYFIGPQLLNPLNPTFDQTPTFEWTSVPGIASYEIYIRTTGGVVREAGLTTTTWTPTANLAQGIIRWWIRASTAAGKTGPWSAAVNGDIGGRTSVQSPVGMISDTTPLLTWLQVTGAGRYILYVERVGVGLEFRDDNVTSTSFTPTTPLAAGSYRVCVKAISAADNVSGFWSNPVDFTIADVDADSVLDGELEPLFHGTCKTQTLRTSDVQAPRSSIRTSLPTIATERVNRLTRRDRPALRALLSWSTRAVSLCRRTMHLRSVPRLLRI